MNYISFKIEGRRLRMERNDGLEWREREGGHALASGDSEAFLTLDMGNPTLSVAHGNWSMERREDSVTVRC